jgi:hypothetical protein
LGWLGLGRVEIGRLAIESLSGNFTVNTADRIL